MPKDLNILNGIGKKLENVLCTIIIAGIIAGGPSLVTKLWIQQRLKQGETPPQVENYFSVGYDKNVLTKVWYWWSYPGRFDAYFDYYKKGSYKSYSPSFDRTKSKVLEV